MTLLILDMFMKSYANVISKIDSDVTVPIQDLFLPVRRYNKEIPQVRRYRELSCAPLLASTFRNFPKLNNVSNYFSNLASFLWI